MIETLKTISAEELHEKITGNSYPILINTLPYDAYESKHIPGSLHIPTDEIEKVKDLIPDKGEEIVVYCANSDCDASPNAAEKLMDMGYESVIDFEQGLAGWRQAGYPLRGSEA